MPSKHIFSCESETRLNRISVFLTLVENQSYLASLGEKVPKSWFIPPELSYVSKRRYSPSDVVNHMIIKARNYLFRDVLSDYTPPSRRLFQFDDAWMSSVVKHLEPYQRLDDWWHDKFYNEQYKRNLDDLPRDDRAEQARLRFITALRLRRKLKKKDKDKSQTSRAGQGRRSRAEHGLPSGLWQEVVVSGSGSALSGVEVSDCVKRSGPMDYGIDVSAQDYICDDSHESENTRAISIPSQVTLTP